MTRHERIHSSELQGQARIDSLTGTPNRTGADELLERQLQRAAETGGSFAILFLDLDRFKDINDTHGHSAGDELLTQVTIRLSTHLRQHDMLARVGGDEFMATLPGANMDTARQTAERLINAFSEPFLVHGKKLQASCSIGAAVFPAHVNSREDLIKCADTAMYEAKRAGRNRFAMYEERFGIIRKRRLVLQEQLQHALEKNQLLLHYQPILDLQSRRIVAAEALLRWQVKRTPAQRGRFRLGCRGIGSHPYPGRVDTEPGLRAGSGLDRSRLPHPDGGQSIAPPVPGCQPGRPGAARPASHRFGACRIGTGNHRKYRHGRPGIEHPGSDGIQAPRGSASPLTTLGPATPH